MRPDVIIAYKLNSYPLMETLRLVIPDANGNMWIAMITSISLSDGGAPDMVAATSGFIANQQNLGTQNSATDTHLTQQTPTPTPDFNTPAPPSSSTPTPTNSPTSTAQQAKPQNLSLEIVYIAPVVVMVAIVFVGLMVIKRKRAKTDL